MISGTLKLPTNLLETVQRYAFKVFAFEDMITKVHREKEERNRDKSKCKHKGCGNDAVEGKVYCRKHLHGS